jgi:multidrug efflux pump
LFSSYQVNVPQVRADVNRDKALAQGVSLSDIFETMQVYLGSLYVNDFNRFGRTYQVNAQADMPFRLEPEDIGQLKVRNSGGDMVPLAAFVSLEQAAGPDRVMHYNGYPSADINAGPAPGYSSGEAEALMAALADASLPNGMHAEWTELTYQKELAGNAGLWVFPLSVLLVLLVLAALYESVTLPLVVILIVPMTLLSAIAGVWLVGGDNNIFTQIGLIVLVGLASKNAIPIRTVPGTRSRGRARRRPWRAM